MKKRLAFSVLFILVFALVGLGQEEKITIIHPMVPLAQFELVTPKGTRLYMDITNESVLSTQPTKNDLLLTTHGHHVCGFMDTFPGVHIKTLAEIERSDFYIKSIPSAHLPGDKLSETEGNNYMFLIETAGMRIAHFGGIGQDVFTPHQLKELGRVDIALMLLAGRASLADIVNLKAFNLMDQVKPRLIIATHLDLETSKYGAEIWDAYYTTNTSLQIDTKALNGTKTKLLFMGRDAKMYGIVTKAKEWPGLN